MKKQHHLICIVASLLFWLVGCSAIQIKDIPVSISQAPLENEEISNSEQVESPLEAEDSTSVTITESGDFSEAEQLGFTGANIGQGGLMAGDGEWVYYRSESDWGLYRARTDGSEQTQLLPPEDYRLLCRITLEGATHLEVAKELGISVWSSQKRLQRIRKKLCKQLLPNKSKKISENMSVLRF